MPGKAVDVVAVRPVETSLIKSNYTLSEFLYAIATSSEPFRNAGDSLLEMYTLVTGEEVRADTRKSVGQWTSALDFATGLVPDVGIARIPGDAAGIAADQMEGRPVAAERLIDMVQAADSHNFGSRGAVRKPPDIAAMREEKQRQVSQRKAQSKASRSSGGAQPDTGAHVDAHRERNVAANEDNAALAAEHTVDARPLDMPYMAHGWPHDWPHEWHIAGENEHLQGYAQSLPPDKLPIDPQRRIVTIDGRFYLRGEAGYYRATRGHSLDHWLISAPKGSGRAATVPVHVDAASGRWQAEAPLRLCGGGCGPSRESTPDSIALDQDKVRDAVAHLRNADIREAIIYAFDDLAALHLSRSNRPDLQATRDNSIIDHRMALRTSMKRIKRSLPLLKQQQEAALITTLYYYWNPWLVDAPRRTKAQVPVTYDPHLDLWVAHEPQRLCGGGCGTSRIGTPDSIALNRHEVDAVLSHLRDDDAQNAILAAYNDVSRMKLLRSNRQDLRQYRDYSIIPNREAIRVALERIPPDTPLYEQQRLAAVITAGHYRLNLGTEAFCQENAEVLFHFLIENGVHGDCIRMITIHPKGRLPHALVLYTESEELIDALELATPVAYEGPGADGISGDNFAGFIMNARDSTLLLDPWSRVKAVGFALSKDPQETRHVLDAAFADVGHRPGEAFRVSLTRPLGPRRTGASRRGSLASQGSAGTASRTSSSGGSSGAPSSSGVPTSLDAPQLPLAKVHEGAGGT